MAGSDRTDGALSQWSRADLVQDDLVAAGLQLADRLVHRRGTRRSRVGSAGQSQAAEANAPAEIATVAKDFIVLPFKC